MHEVHLLHSFLLSQDRVLITLRGISHGRAFFRFEAALHLNLCSIVGGDSVLLCLHGVFGLLNCHRSTDFNLFFFEVDF